MFRSGLRRLGLLLAAASCSALVVASLGADEAWAGTCGTANINFELGNTATNSCNTNTDLSGSGSVELRVENTAAGGTALFGWAQATTGAGTGVFGRTESSGADAYGVFGFLYNTSPGSPS